MQLNIINLNVVVLLKICLLITVHHPLGMYIAVPSTLQLVLHCVLSKFITALQNMIVSQIESVAYIHI